MITFKIVGEGAAARTAAISACVPSSRPALTRPRSITMSTSSAPRETDSAASNAFVAGVCLPEGKPQTVASLTWPSGASTGSIAGETQIE